MFNINSHIVGIQNEALAPYNLLGIECPNLNYIEDLADGDFDFRDSLIEHLNRELPLELDRIKNSLDRNVPLELADNIHKIKHKFAMLGMKKHNEVCQVVERNIRDGQEMNAQVELLLTGAQRMMDFLIKDSKI